MPARAPFLSTVWPWQFLLPTHMPRLEAGNYSTLAEWQLWFHFAFSPSPVAPPPKRRDEGREACEMMMLMTDGKRPGRATRDGRSDVT